MHSYDHKDAMDWDRGPKSAPKRKERRLKETYGELEFATWTRRPQRDATATEKRQHGSFEQRQGVYGYNGRHKGWETDGELEIATWRLARYYCSLFNTQIGVLTHGLQTKLLLARIHI